MMTQRRSFKLSLSTKKKLVGYAFISPFLIGFVLFFLESIIQSFIFSFSTVQLSATGYHTTWSGWANYEKLFLKDASFLPDLFQTLQNNLTDVVLILIISFFVAILLNQQFKGRLLARAIFFLPVIITSGILLKFEQNTMAMISKTFAEGQQAAGGDIGQFFSYNLYFLLKNANLNADFVGFIMSAIDSIYSIVTRSGVQILIFLSALQTIPPSLKEAAYMDGATGWEFFWKITFPMVSSFILVNLVYTIIDSFTNPNNPIMEKFNDTMFNQVNFSLGSALGWTYFITILLTMGVLALIISRRVYYEE